jgi:hypothetical protein
MDNHCVHGTYAQFTALAAGNLATFGMDTSVATSVIPHSIVTSNIFYKTTSRDTDYPLGIISDGVYQLGSDNNDNSKGPPN